MYLFSGVGGGFGSFFVGELFFYLVKGVVWVNVIIGRFVDWNYKRMVKRGGDDFDKNFFGFFFEKIRLKGVYIFYVIIVLGIIGYGLVLKFRVVSVCLFVVCIFLRIDNFFIVFCCDVFYVIFNWYFNCCNFCGMFFKVFFFIWY